MGGTNGRHTSSRRTSTIYGCRFISRDSARPSMICPLISISTSHRQPLFHNRNLKVPSNQTPSPHLWGKMTANQALWARKKLHQPPPLLNLPSEHPRSQGISVLWVSSAEISEGGLAISSSVGSAIRELRLRATEGVESVLERASCNDFELTFGKLNHKTSPQYKHSHSSRARSYEFDTDLSSGRAEPAVQPPHRIGRVPMRSFIPETLQPVGRPREEDLCLHNQTPHRAS